MRIWDISMPVHAEMPVWKGKDEKRPHLIVTRDFQNGKGGRERLVMDAHTGTHDARSTLSGEMGPTPWNSLRKAKVIDLSAIQDVIYRNTLRPWDSGEISCCLRRNSTEPSWSRTLFTSLAVAGTCGHGSSVGIDSLGVSGST